ncbi:hypothetical protein ACJIZ3_002068 [Penstemon smallii]|uniref:Uncharacterized protein n=1 Tax=Penstemon smallii TaxID=265156 RepID=A0ABD3U6T0_9LAMI
MALLASCWLIIEIFIIPHGFLKWFYLSFYINPFSLLFCQIFLWLKKLQRWILVFLCFLFRISDYLSSFIFIFMKRVATLLSSFTRQPEIEVFYDVIDHEIPEISTQNSAIVVSCSNWINSKCDTFCESRLQSVVVELRNDCKDSWLNEYLMSSDQYNSASSFTNDMDIISDRSLSSGDITLSPSSSFNDQEFICTLEDSGVDYINIVCPQVLVISRNSQEDTDSIFHKMYTERMKFFDVLYQERSYGMNAILTSPSSLMSPMNFSRRKIETKMLLKSLESDFELVYVAQSCLSWEALHYQYRRFEVLACSNTSQDHILFCTDVLEKFREFQILLERFMEDEKSLEGKRHSNYIHRRCQLHVPDAFSGSSTEGGNISIGREYIRASEVLKAIEKCIKAFWIYVKTDNKKLLSKFKAIYSSYSQVEDPRDLELLFNLTKALHKKGQLVKDLQRKRNGWLKRKVKPLESDMKDDVHVLFTMIDLKLVEMVLKMSIISTSHLEWCQEKLNNLDFKQGKIYRDSKSCLFPSS